MITLGVGEVFLTSGSGTSAQSILAGSVSELSVDLSWEEVQLYGNKQFPIHVGRTKAKLGGKMKIAKFERGVLAAVLAGSTTTAGTRIGVIAESTGTISGATYTAATVTGFQDRGAKDETGAVLKQVAATPAVGEYSVSSSGVYTFNSAATGKVYTVSYTYLSASTGKTVAYTNQLMGTAPSFTIDAWNTNPDGSKYGILFYACSIPKFGLAFKNADYASPDMDFTAYANSSDKVLDVYFPAGE